MQLFKFVSSHLGFEAEQPHTKPYTACGFKM